MTNEPENTLAAEYVLGLLDADAQAQAERRLAREPEFAREVEQWRARFADFDATAITMQPADNLWRRIEATTQAPAPRQTSRESFLSGLWNSLAAWRLATAGAMAAVLALGVFSAVTVRDARELAARKPIFIAVLMKEGTNEVGAVVNAFATGRTELIPVTDIPVKPGRALEIWTLWDRTVGPRSIGLIDRARTVTLNVKNLPPTGANQLFEITDEPATGSPIGRPTGDILYKGTTTRAL